MRAAVPVLLFALALSGCGRKPSGVVADAGAPLAPLGAESWLVELPGGAKAAVPLGAREPRPLVIALPGAVDRPEWECGTWRGISRAQAFVLCPGSFDEAELRAALRALKGRFGRHLAPGPVVLVALGAGVSLAVRLWRKEPEFFARVVLIEGEGSLASADAYGIVRRGGRRALWVCARPECQEAAARSALFFRDARGEARVLSAPPDARGLDGRLAAALQQEWAWLVEGDARYRR